MLTWEEDEAAEPELVVEPDPDDEPEDDPVEDADVPELVVVLLAPLPVAEDEAALEVEVELAPDESEVVGGQVRLKRGVDDSSCVMANFCLLPPLSSTKLYQ